MPFEMDGEKCVLLRIFSRSGGKPPGIVAAQPGVQFSEQLLVGSAFAALRGGHQRAPFVGPSSPIFRPRCSIVPMAGIVSPDRTVCSEFRHCRALMVRTKILGRALRS